MVLYMASRKKTCLVGRQLGPTQTWPYNQRFEHIYIEKTKPLISAFVFPTLCIIKCSDDAAHIETVEIFSSPGPKANR